MKSRANAIASTAVFLLALLTAAPAWCKEAPDLYSIPIFAESEPLSATSPDSRYISFGPNARPWLPRILRVLKKRRPPSFEIALTAIVANNQDDEYLLIEWFCEPCYNLKRLEIHKVFDRPGAHKGVRFLRQWVGQYDYFTSRTGLPLTPGGNPLIVVHEGSGGSGAEGYRLVLFEARRNTVDIVPPGSGRVVAIRDFDNDGRFEVLSLDSRWAGAFDTRGAAGPHVPIVLSRTERGFRPVCTSHPRLYQQYIARSVKFLLENKDIAGPYYFEILAEMALASAQAGFFDAAAKFTGKLNANRDIYVRWYSAEYADAYISTSASISGFIAALKKDQNPGCFVSATAGRGRHTGAKERFNASR